MTTIDIIIKDTQDAIADVTESLAYSEISHDSIRAGIESTQLTMLKGFLISLQEIKLEAVNPCKEIKINEPIIDIPFMGERVQFKGLNAKQMSCLSILSEFFNTSGERKGVQILKD